MTKVLRYLGLFSGIGGIELGIRQASNELAWKAECAGFSEIDPKAVSIFVRHFKADEAKNYGDATKLDAEMLPDFDFLVGGFPCQAFSMAGRRLGFDDTRGTLFFDIARILGHKRPRHFLLENVPGLLSHDDGKTFQTILEVLTNLGYCCEWQVLDSRDFGIPQGRKRIYIVGHFGGPPTQTVFPFWGLTHGQDVKRSPKQAYVKNTEQTQQDGNSLQDVLGEAWVEELENAFRTVQGRHLLPRSKNCRFLGQLLLAWLSCPLSASEKQLGFLGSEDQQKQAKGLFGQQQTGIRWVDGLEVVGTPVTWCWDDGASRKVMRVFEEVSPTLKKSRSDYLMLTKNGEIRKLTPVECERLQGFPDDWTRWGQDGEEIRDSVRYGLLGNSVTVPVVRWVVERILSSMI